MKCLRWLLPWLLVATAPVRAAADAPAADAATALAPQLQALAARALPQAARVEVELGRLDPRLQLAPCARIEPQLPPGARLWGTSRLALRCVEGATRWQVWLPVTVKVYGRALAARAPLAAGATLGAADLVEAEVDLAAERGGVHTEPGRLVGRVLAQPLAVGTAVRDTHLKPRSWFDAGDTVRVVAGGGGWRVSGEGVALAPGLEGRSVRVRTPSGRIVSGRAVAPRTMEVPL